MERKKRVRFSHSCYLGPRQAWFPDRTRYVQYFGVFEAASVLQCGLSAEHPKAGYAGGFMSHV